jgi:membrane-associated phospholipid phosphatase
VPPGNTRELAAFGLGLRYQRGLLLDAPSPPSFDPREDLRIGYANLLLELEKESPAARSISDSRYARYTALAGRLHLIRRQSWIHLRNVPIAERYRSDYRADVIFLTDLADQAVILPAAVITALMLALTGWMRGTLIWLAAVLATIVAIAVLKIGFAACGPVQLGDLVNSPSGHVASGAIIYGGLVGLLMRHFGVGRSLALLPAPLIATLIGITRIDLGVHTLPEVLIGGAVGCVAVFALLVLAGAPPRRLQSARLLGPTVLIVAVMRFNLVRAMAGDSASEGFPTMATTKLSDAALLAFFHGHPELRERLSSIVNVVGNADGNLGEADAAEERLVEETRLLGREAMRSWADERVVVTEREVRLQPGICRQGKTLVAHEIRRDHRRRAAIPVREQPDAAVR